MPVSRGSVKHSILENMVALIKCFFFPKFSCRAANAEEKKNLQSEINNYFGSSYSVLFPFARTGLYSILKSLQLPAGTEVLMTPITIGPMCEVMQALGLKPKFIDIELETFGPDLDKLREELKTKPSVFLLTYLFGHVPNIEKISEMCRSAGTFLIEDFSHNIGAAYNNKKIGTFGDASIHSASLLKYVDGYNGAFVLCRDAQLASKISETTLEHTTPNPNRIKVIVLKTLIWNLALSRFVFNFATYPALLALKLLNPVKFEKLLGPAIKFDLARGELPAYYFEDISSIQCRTISKKLLQLDHLVTQRRECANRAGSALSLTKFKATSPFHRSQANTSAYNSYWQFLVPVTNPNEVRKKLFYRGVETGTTNLYNLADCFNVELRNARDLKNNYMFVPLHAHLSQSDYANLFKILR